MEKAAEIGKRSLKPFGVRKRGDWTDLIINGTKVRAYYFGPTRDGYIFRGDRGQKFFIYSYGEHEDHLREILADTHRYRFNKHIPRMEKLGSYFDRQSEQSVTVFSSAYYERLTHYFRDVWRYSLELKAARERALEAIIEEPSELLYKGSDVNYELIEQAEDIPQSLKRALNLLADTSYMYGPNFMFGNFTRKSLCVDGWGNLVLFDPLIDNVRMLLDYALNVE